jgi:hypothetical protein
MVTRNMRRAEIPEARKEAVEDLRPAEEKRSGAYWFLLEFLVSIVILEWNIRITPHQSPSTVASLSETPPD